MHTNLKWNPNRVQYWKNACIRNKNCFVVSFIWKLFQNMVQQNCKNNNKLFEEWHHIFLLFRSSFSKWAFQLFYRHFCIVKKERSKSPHLKTDFFSQEIPHWKGQPSLITFDLKTSVTPFKNRGILKNS